MRHGIQHAHKALTERRGFSKVHPLECKMDDPTAQDASDVCCGTAPAGAAPFCWVCIRGSAEELCAAALCHSRLWCYLHGCCQLRKHSCT